MSFFIKLSIIVVHNWLERMGFPGNRAFLQDIDSPLWLYTALTVSTSFIRSVDCMLTFHCLLNIIVPHHHRLRFSHFRTSPVNNHYPSPHISPSPIHLNPFHSPQHPLPQSPLHPHPAAPSSQPPHGMFAPPLPTAVSITPQPGPTNTHNPFSVDPMSYASKCKQRSLDKQVPGHFVGNLSARHCCDENLF